MTGVAISMPEHRKAFLDMFASVLPLYNASEVQEAP
jgi:hypothetical protein